MFQTYYPVYKFRTKDTSLIFAQKIFQYFKYKSINHEIIVNLLSITIIVANYNYIEVHN